MDFATAVITAPDGAEFDDKIVGGIALWVASYIVSSRSEVELERLDSDGFIRLARVHPVAGEAIVAASLARPSE